MPFLTEHLWLNLVPDGPASIQLAGWPEVPEPDCTVLDEMAVVRRVVALAHRARATSGLKVRQPLRRLVVAGAGGAQGHSGEIADELRVKEVEFGTVEASELRVKPNLPVLGPKLGAKLGEVRQALASGEFEELEGGRFRVNGYELEPDEVSVERVGLDGWAVASEDGITVALDTSLDEELRLEARVNDLVRDIQNLRKASGLEIVDRIRLWIPDAELLPFSDRIAGETLAVAVEHGDELRLEKA
jgi:isoleucyl-tRNA synthetase